MCFILVLPICSIKILAQSNHSTIKVEGVVKDSISGKSLEGVSILIYNRDRGVISNKDGFFRIYASETDSIKVSCVGYAHKSYKIGDIKRQNFSIKLVPTYHRLNEIEIRSDKDRYSKKNNPAVDIIKNIHSSMDKYSPLNLPYYSYDKHSKMRIAINDFQLSEEQYDKSKWKFVKEYVDTSEVTGRPILPVITDEKISKELWSKFPRRHKEIIEGSMRNTIVDVFDQESLDRFIYDIFREVDIFANDINIMQNRFVSPLSTIATNYYKFYLMDTISIDNKDCVEINFTPHNRESFGFYGRIFLPLEDSLSFIKKVELHMPKVTNLNYVKSIYISQVFDKREDGTRLKVRDDMTVEFELVPGAQGLYARRQIAYNNFEFNRIAKYESYYDDEKDVITLSSAKHQPLQFWNDRRLITEKYNESSIEDFLNRLRDIPFFYWTEQVIKVIISGYIHTSPKSKIDIGPVNTFVSTNSLEGVRFRVGGVTTAMLHNQLFARGYIAYGIGDKKLKYDAELEYSFNKKDNHSREFPIHSIRVEHNYDIDQIGQHYLFTNKDNIFLSLKRKTDDKATYRRLSTLNYKMERYSGFSFDIGFRYERQEATHSMPFEDGYGNIYKSYDQAAFTISLRYAPNESFYQTKSERIPINQDSPVFQLTHQYCPKGFLGSAFTVNRTEFSARKRFWFSAFGYTDILIKAGKIWSQVQYPALMWPNANLSYTIQNESYSLMNVMEFANDQYIAWDITYWANGALFNRIPLVNRLKLREVVTFKGLYGSLSDRNNPELNNNLYRFPYQTFAKPMDKKPYMELSIGIDNILTFLRVDYVWRLTYRNTPNVDKSGVRVQLHFTF